MLKRPEAYNTVLDENNRAYASYVNIGGSWMGGLFAKHDLQAKDEIARYVGKEYYPSSTADSVTDQSYMFTARMVQDGRKRVVIDGNPKLYKNLAGFANYVEGNAANAHFVDKANEADDTLSTNIILQAATFIPSGTEIRVDYDMGSSTHPFRDQMLEKGIPLSALRDPSYAEKKWLHPNVSHASATAIESVNYGLPLVEDITRVEFFENEQIPRSPKRSPKSPKRSPKSPKRKRSPKSPKQRSPEKTFDQRKSLKRPRGRPPKGKIWHPEQGYI